MIAPPPHILARARDFIQPKAGRYLALAQRVAEEAERSGLGRRVGAVVVDPDLEASIAEQAATNDNDNDNDIHWSDAIVAVAGDGRYSRADTGTDPLNPPNQIATTYSPDHEGGPELHALMRAVELIASKRREDRPGSSATNRPCLTEVERYFLSKSDSTTTTSTQPTEPEPETESKESTPLPPPEKYQKTTETSAHPIHTTSISTSKSTSRIRPRSQGGYLCTDLDVYLTHEPCICCSMGLLLSRFRAVVFPRSGRMVSGGLASEPVVKPVPVEEGNENENENENVAEKTNDDNDDDGSVKREYYGLHWRKELNWRALGFEFVEEENGEGVGGQGSAELGVAFHA
ncbi:adenosine deaminase, tRNA-specific 3 [Aspergillus brasiliensis]|nr:adenosine deaminase, tRNA-specific 3 [Aspergillus brasiliensis]